MTSDLEVYEDATLTAQRLDDATGASYGAVYDRTGRLVPGTARTTDSEDRHAPADPPVLRTAARYVGRYGDEGAAAHLDEAVFGGLLLEGWGHLVTETLGSAWAAPRFPRAHLVLAPWGRVWFSSLRRTGDLLRLAGWTGPTSVLADGARVGRLHVPRRLVDLRAVIDDGQPLDLRMDAVYETVRSRALCDAGVPDPTPALLARPDGHRRRHPAEQELEQRAQALGLRVVRGWQVPVAEQVRAVAGASALIGLSGSNLHNSVFASRGTRLVEVLDAREQERQGRGRRSLQDALCRLRGQPRTTVPGEDGSGPRRAADVLDDVLAALAP